MINAFFDTNVMLDAIDIARPQCNEAREALRLCNEGFEIYGYTCPMSLKDMFYILSRSSGKPNAFKAIEHLMGLLIVAPVSDEGCDMALRDGEPDFEDGLIRATAELEGMDYIITRDKDAFAGSSVRSVTAAEFVAAVSKGAAASWSSPASAT